MEELKEKLAFWRLLKLYQKELGDTIINSIEI